MNPFTTIAMVVYAVVSLLHAIRLAAGRDVTIAGFAVPAWWSASGCLIAGYPVVMVWKEARA
jgi:hypothetical protein